MFQNLFDSHTHSENSLDGHHSVIFMVESAVERGIHGLSVTDHCDCDALEAHSYARRQLLTAMDVAKAREAFRGRLSLTHGVELGQPHYDYAGAERLLASQHFDFVLLALHRMRNQVDFYDMDYAEMSADTLHALTGQYFDELLELVKWGRFDSAAHLTLPARYPKVRQGYQLDLRRYAAAIDEILRVLAQDGKALEVNTSGLRNGQGDTLPPAWILRRFRELGGELVTLGSDAHFAGDIGAGIQEAMQMALDAGFDHFAFYRNRKPVMLRII